MALWGKADGIYSPGTVTVNYASKTITGSGTSFTAAGVSTGTVITLGVGGTFGQAVVSGITSDTVISIATTQYLSGAAISGVAYTMSQKPVYTLEDPNYDLTPTTSPGLTNFIEGVDEYEAAALKETGSKYAVAHSGWVGVHTYIDCHGNFRVKSEVLVAMSGISSNTPATYGATGDAADDAILPDRFIAISVQPQSASVGVGTTVTFSVTAAATPTSALSYQWQKSTTAGGTSFSNIGGETNSTVSIANTNTANNGYLYRVVITAAGGATATSNSATLTVS
jgi:hypothetical protein